MQKHVNRSFPSCDDILAQTLDFPIVVNGVITISPRVPFAPFLSPCHILHL